MYIIDMEVQNWKSLGSQLILLISIIARPDHGSSIIARPDHGSDPTWARNRVNESITC